MLRVKAGATLYNSYYKGFCLALARPKQDHKTRHDFIKLHENTPEKNKNSEGEKVRKKPRFNKTQLSSFSQKKR